MADISITATSVIVDSSPTPSIDQQTYAGATITAGQVVYKDSSDSDELKLADNDNTETTADAYGIALCNASDGQPCPVFRKGVITIGATVVVGTQYVLSSTAGGIAPAADLDTGDYVTSVGMGYTTGKLACDFTASKNSTGQTHA